MFLGFKRWRTLAVASMVLACTAGAAPPLTQIQDMIYTADGLPFNGIIEVAWQPFTASDTSVIAAKTLRLTVTNGFLNISLTPTTTALTPASYSVVYISGGKNQSGETWAVPPSAAPVRIQDIRTMSDQTAPPPASSTQISIGDVTGLAAELALKLQQGVSFAISRAAVIDSFGQIDGASGTSSDCLHVDGSSGPCGSAASTLGFSDHETPSGAMNGSNAVFSLMNTPSPAGSLDVFRNGMLLNPASDYLLSANVVTFSANAIPQAADVLDASYRYGADNSGLTFADGETPGGTVNGSNITFTLAAPPNPPSSLRLYRNGLAMKPGVDYNLSGSTVAFLAASTPQAGDVLLAFYRK